ncbi:Amidase [Lasiodiplodia theobromae]|uniref:Amidase n=1 Tax=Lasiodiplodia theobromae TaxID=45133 RepID=UPI0015C2F30F|nr:Amidase [Lasiodiplodia theobromae]KAF4537685.1 Amidase [Lasiodiplodia theobromae]
MATTSSIDITNASISQLQDALSTGATTSVELVARFLHRIGKYDFRGPSLNSICVLNPDVFKEAQNSDDYRASGHPPRSLEGIPFTLKDSFSVKGLTVAAASPAFIDLVASSDAAVVESLRAAGAILIGKTNMPPMADGGSQRGAYGRSTSPYNPEYLPTSFASGSSYGSGVATSCSFAPIGLGGETVSSGRAPASHNALVGYSPSRGVIPARGQWPLYPTCDVVVPHAKSMEDLFAILNAIVNDDPEPSSAGDFWRSQHHVPIPPSSSVRPADYLTLADPTALRGKRIAVPKCYIGQPTTTGNTATISPATLTLWHRAAADLASLGATLIYVDAFPLADNYARQLFPGQAANVPGVPASWIDVERCELIAVAWDDFLRRNADPNIPSLAAVDHTRINPGFAPMDDPSAFTETQNHVRYAEMVEFVRTRRPDSVYDLPGCADALRALEAARKRDLEDWMDAHGFDVLAFPTNGDVGRAEAEEDAEAMRDALREGVKYSNGGRALKHLGVPAVTVPMGVLADKQMPVGITFAGRAYGDNELLRCAYAYERATGRRGTGSPPLAPGLETDVVVLGGAGVVGSEKPRVVVEWSDVTKRSDEGGEIRNVSLGGTVRCEGSSVAIESMKAFVNGEESAAVTLKGESWEWNAQLKRPHVRDKYPTPGKIPRDQFMIVFLARASNGRSTGILLLED